jgi:integrase
MKTNPRALPGTLWLNSGRWNWRVHLPGTPARANYPLRLHGQKIALAEEKGESLAESIAWRMWEKASRQENAAHDNGMTLDDAAGRFMAHAESYYRRADGTQTREAFNCELALRPIRAAHGQSPVDDVTYQDILDARDALIAKGLNRTTVNQRVGIWRRFFSWALENRLVSPTTKAEVCAISNLKRGRCPAPEGEQVLPVSHLVVKRTVAILPPNLRAMIGVQELCGARPSEICTMRPCDIERRRGVWVYRPASHKTEHKGNCRVIVLGPRAVAILTPLLASVAPQARVFHPERGSRAGEAWQTSTYGQAIRKAVIAVKKAGVDVPEWAPNQLRHACGTRVRRKFGPAAASAVLGHSAVGGARITDNYTRSTIEREMISASTRPMLAIG